MRGKVLHELVMHQADRSGHTLLMCAARYCLDARMVGRLIKAGAGVNDQDSDGMTPLMYAARYNVNVDVCRLLLREGAQVNAVDKKGSAALDLSELNPNAELLRFTLQEAGARPQGEREAVAPANGLQVSMYQRPEGSLVIQPDGYIDTYNTEWLYGIINKAIDDGHLRLIFDCQKLQYISSAFDLFLSALKRCRKAGGNVILARVQPRIKEIYDLLGFSQFFWFWDDLEETFPG
jgi:anti-anti-sigma factor